MRSITGGIKKNNEVVYNVSPIVECIVTEETVTRQLKQLNENEKNYYTKLDNNLFLKKTLTFLLTNKIDKQSNDLFSNKNELLKACSWHSEKCNNCDIFLHAIDKSDKHTTSSLWDENGICYDLCWLIEENKIKKDQENFVYLTEIGKIIEGKDVIINNKLSQYKGIAMEKQKLEKEIAENNSKIELIKFNQKNKLREAESNLENINNKISELRIELNQKKNQIESMRNDRVIDQLYLNTFPFYFNIKTEIDKLIVSKEGIISHINNLNTGNQSNLDSEINKKNENEKKLLEIMNNLDKSYFYPIHEITKSLKIFDKLYFNFQHAGSEYVRFEKIKKKLIKPNFESDLYHVSSTEENFAKKYMPYYSDWFYEINTLKKNLKLTGEDVDKIYDNIESEINENIKAEENKRIIKSNKIVSYNASGKMSVKIASEGKSFIKSTSFGEKKKEEEIKEEETKEENYFGFNVNVNQDALEERKLNERENRILRNVEFSSTFEDKYYNNYNNEIEKKRDNLMRKRNY